MRRVPVMEAGRSTVTTGGGDVCGVIGAGRVVAGDVAWQMGDMIFSPGKKGSRPVFDWGGKSGYRLASAYELKMMTVDKDSMEIISEEAIERPVENAQLLAHTYNENVEYLIWFVDSRCIIQKDGETIADFASAFYSVPNEIDAYVDDNDDLIWGAAGEGAGIVTMADYKNGSVTKTASYSEEAIEAEYAERIRQRAAAVQYSAWAGSSSQITNTWAFCSTIPRNFEIYRMDYAGLNVSQKPYLLTGDASVASGAIFDLFNADALIPVYSYGTVFVQVHNAAYGVSYNDPLNFSDQSYDSGGQAVQVANVTIFRFSDGALIAETQQQSEGTEETVLTRQWFSQRVSEAYDATPTEITGYVVTNANVPITNSSFCLDFTGIAGQIVTGIMQKHRFDVTGKAGENNGVVRSGIVTGVVSAPGRVVYSVAFDSSWPEIPEPGNFFGIEMYFGVQTEVRTEGDLHLTTIIPSFEYNNGAAITTDLGNGYATRRVQTVGNVYGWVSLAGELLYNGQKIHDAQEQNFLDGAWKTEDGKAVGVAGYEIIKADGAEVKLIEPQYNPNVATRRFV